MGRGLAVLIMLAAKSTSHIHLVNLSINGHACIFVTSFPAFVVMGSESANREVAQRLVPFRSVQ